MITSRNMQFSIIATFIWIGFVGAISFMEAWLKFRAEGITIPLGLSIGRLVFAALNKVEWVLSAVIILNMLWIKKAILKTENFAFYIPFIILVLQTFWILPILDARAQVYLDGSIPPDSNYHIIYIALEFVKVFCLSVFGFVLLKLKIQH